MLSLLGLVSGSFCVEALVARASRVVVVLGLSRGIWVEALVPRESFAPTRKSNAAGRPGMMYVFFFALTVACGMSAGSDLARSLGRPNTVGVGCEEVPDGENLLADDLGCQRRVSDLGGDLVRDGRHVLVELSNELGIGDDGLVALFLNDLLPVAADVARHRVLEGSTPLLAGGSHCRRLTAAVVGE